MTRPSRTCLLACALLCAAAILAVRGDEAEAVKKDVPERKPAEMAVVKTWKDLLAQPEIDLGKSGKVRLGIEAAEASAGGSVTLFALVEGEEAFEGEHSDDESLGMLGVKVQREGEKKLVQELQKSAFEEERSRGLLLYRQMVAMDDSGAVTVKLLAHGGKEIAFAKIALKEEKVHLWSPFAWPDDAKEAMEEEQSLAPVIRSEDVAAPGTGWAEPKFDGTVPMICAESADPSADRHFRPEEPLPSLQFDRPNVPKEIKLSDAKAKRFEELLERLGDEDVGVRDAAEIELEHDIDSFRAALAKRLEQNDPEIRARILELLRPFGPKLTIRFSGDAILIESKLGMEIEGANESFLVRWWVNGKPVIPSNEESLQKVHDAMKKMSDSAVSAFQLNVKLNLDKLGAKSGDTIGVQVLFCPHGWKSDIQLAELDKIDRMHHDTEIFDVPTASNIAEWKVP
ncbi:MAG: hypothetical protein HY291_03630 [Planctomycetes bacterium]|nr:hypothetical protein [Planctomycetota bacterium]